MSTRRPVPTASPFPVDVRIISNQWHALAAATMRASATLLPLPAVPLTMMIRFSPEVSIRFAWIAAEKAEHPIAECCRALWVSASGLRCLAAAARVAACGAGSPAARVDPSVARGQPPEPGGSRISSSRHPYQSHAGRAADAGRGAQGPRPEAVPLDHDERSRSAIAGHVLDRPFVAERPNQRWVGEMTEFLIGIGSSAKR